MKTTTKYTPEAIAQILSKNDRAVERAMHVLYRLQTASEQVNSETSVHNGVGFSAAHARLGSYYARWVMCGKALTGNHLVRARKIALKYTRQLSEVANERAASK